MNLNDLFTRRLACVARLATLAAWGAGLPALAQPAVDVPVAADPADAVAPAAPEAPDPWAEGDTVRDLLRADARAARASRSLRRANDWLATTPQAGDSPVRGRSPDAVDRLDVLAIYGVGKALHADVSVNGRLVRYRAGRAMPVAGGGAVPGESYALVAIDGPCVRLRRAGEPRTACLSAGDAAHD